ncbi:hypothetical protein J6590_020768 [Homalodisca vitripennis]|nr:hypothetical protein J6590_020768 [Homalodisca vitripennis]
MHLKTIRIECGTTSAVNLSVAYVTGIRVQGYPFSDYINGRQVAILRLLVVTAHHIYQTAESTVRTGLSNKPRADGGPVV